MIGQRKHRQWKNKNKIFYQSPKNKSTLFLILEIAFWLALISLTIKNRQQFLQNNFVKQNYFHLDELKTKISSKISDIDSINKTSVIAGSSNELKTTDFKTIDNYASAVHYEGNSVVELASLLSRYAKTEPEKARIIFSWIAYNIIYDVPAYLSGNYGDLSPEGVLQSRKGVCSGYANLYKALAKAMNLDVVVVEGYAKGYGYVVGNNTQINHAWNAVKINTKWYLLDSTWGAGNINNGQFDSQFNPYYFATPPIQFILDHFPVEKKWQLLESFYDKQQFDTLPKISPNFFKSGLHLVSPHSHTIQASGRFQVVLSAPSSIIAISQLKSGFNSLEDNYSFTQKQDDKIIVTAAPPVGDSELEIFAKSKNISGAYQHVITYKVFSKKAGEEFPKTYSSFSEKNSYLYTPLTKDLPANQSVYFKIKVPTALEVQVIDTSSSKWIKLTRSGSTFFGNVPVSSNKIQVAAKFPSSEGYWTLVEYN